MSYKVRAAKIRPQVLRLAIASIFVFSVSPVSSFAADPSSSDLQINIPSQSLASAITELSKQTGVQIISNANLLTGKKSISIKGKLTPSQALKQMLEGSGLKATEDQSHNYTISVNPDPVSTLPEVEVKDAHEENGYLPEYAGGQVAKSANLGLLGRKDIMDTPFSIVGYTEKTIRDQQATSIAEVLTSSDSSVRASIGSSNRYDALTIRGFRVDNDEIALNGLYGLVPAFRVGPDPVERIELLKGPGAFLNGMLPWGSVGGGVNIVTKRASDNPLTRVTAEYLSDAHVGGHIDVGRRFGENNEWGVRVNGAIRTGDTSIDNQFARNGSASIGLDYRGERLRASADIISQNDRMNRAARGYTPASGVPIPSTPDPKINLAQSFDYSDARSLTEIMRLELDASQDVTLYGAIGNNNFNYDKQEAPGATILNTAGDAISTSKFQRGRSHNVSGEAGVRIHAETGPITHQLVFSGNLLDQTTWLGQTLYGNYATNIYNPVRLTSAGLPTSSSAVTKSSESTLQSLAVADTLSIQDGLVQLTLGARRQQVKTKYFATSGAVTDSYDESATTPSIALVVRPTKQLSFYGNYIEALTAGATPPADAANVNQVFAPYKSKQYEIGTKVDLGRFGATLSLFQINVPSGIVNPVTKIYSLSGEQRNQGIELNGYGELDHNLRLLGGVTLMDAKLRSTQNGTNDGNHAIGAPSLQANLGLEYDTTFIPGLTITGRAVYTDKAYVSADNLQSVPAWTRYDLGGRYTTNVSGKSVVIRANVTNLFNRNYWEANPSGYLISGMPRMLWASVATDF